MGLLVDLRRDLRRALRMGARPADLVVEISSWVILSYRVGRAISSLPTPLRRAVRLMHAPVHAVLQAVGGVEIPVSAAIGGGLHMRHTYGVVIHSDARVGLDCNLSQGVTIGIGGRGDRRGVPWLGDRVYVGPGAKLFGPISVGTDSAVGANAVVNRDVPRHVVVAGVPARVVSTAGSTGLVVPGEDQPDSSDRIPDNNPILKVA